MSKATAFEAELGQAKDLFSSLVDVDRGELLEGAQSGERWRGVDTFAAAVPELFAGDQVAWDSVFGTAGATPQHIMLVSPGRVHVAQRLARNPALALVSVAPRTRSVGLILSEARARLNQV